MYLKKLFFPILLSIECLHAQSSIGIDINNKDLEIMSTINLNALTDYSDSTTYLIDSYYLNSDGKNLFAISLSAENTLQGIEGLTLGFGARFVFADNFTALPLFGKATFVLPFNDSIPSTSIGASFAYAPSVLTFNNGESYAEFRLETAMEIIQNIHLFAGYRNIDIEYRIYDKTFNESFYGGIKLGF